MDDLMDDISMIKEDIVLRLEELQQMMLQSPPPWTDLQMIQFETMYDTLLEKKSEWEQELNRIKGRTDRIANDNELKAELRQILRDFKMNMDNREIIRRLKYQTINLHNYLEHARKSSLHTNNQFSGSIASSLNGSVFEYGRGNAIGHGSGSIVSRNAASLITALGSSAVQRFKSDDDVHTLADIGSHEDLTFTPIAVPKQVKYITTPIPPLNIPKFKGNYMEWDSFWQRFKYAVDSKPYPKIEKLYALMNLLEGRAKEEVDGFQLNDQNYDTVVQTLTDRFDDKQAIISELQVRLRTLPPATSEPTSIRHAVNAVHNICRQLQNHGSNIDNEPMKLDIMDRMPDDLRNELYWYNRSENATTEQILRKMKQMALKAETTPPPRETSTVKPIDNMRNSKLPPSSWKIATKLQPPNKPEFCSLCNGQHKPSTCSTYSTPQEKLKQLKNQKRCINCMGSDHMANNCSKRNLICSNCKKPHHSFLCQTPIAGNSSKAMLSINKNQNAMMVKKVVISHPQNPTVTEANIFFDSGSQRSYISKKLIKKLGLPIVNEEPLTVTGFGGKKSCYRSELLLMKLKTVTGWKEIYANSTATESITDRIPVIEKQSDGDFVRRYTEPDILIGMDYYYECIRDSKKIKKDLNLVNSIFGEMYCGKYPIESKHNTVSSLVIESDETTDGCEMFWKLESMGITDGPHSTPEDEIAQMQFEESMKFEDGRYFISWPFKSNHQPLPSNAGLAIARLRTTLKKLRQNPESLAQYQAILDDQLRRGTIEIAPYKPQGPIVHYLPHHAVINELKATTKVRMVFNGSAKASKNEPSLNECMHRGPIDMPEIPGLLFRLRTSAILVTGDIEKAFHQIYLNEPDRDAVRFFWVKDPSKDPVGDNLITYRFVGVPFGVISSPSILNVIIKCHLKKKNDPKLLALLKTFFVDNLFSLHENPTEAIKMFHLARDYFLSASMNLREWLSNDPMVNEAIPAEIKQTSSITKILGLKWDSSEDTISIELKNDIPKEPWTKRKVLKFIASTYDPIGFLSPVTIKGRIFMQKLFQHDLKWDDRLNSKLVDEWKTILNSWNGSVSIPRRFVQCKFPSSDCIEIHTFADASKFAYCAAVYLRIKTEDGYRTPMVFAKTRLQPLNKNLTIPKMEVMGIWLAAKLGSYAQKEMDLQQSPKFIWTDSQISYHWFKKWPKEIFVTNRLKEVLESKSECLFVPGKINPADLGTRGISIKELQNSPHWLDGPEFLKKDRDDWPKTPQFAADVTQTMIALVEIGETYITDCMQTVETAREYDIDTRLSWKELKLQIAQKMKNSDKLDPIDIKEAENAILRQEQELLIKPNDHKQFKLYKDDEAIYRIKCRFDHAELINAHPILLPKSSPIGKLIARETHEELHHAGVPHTLSKLREKFWIPSGRATVKKSLNKCPQCKLWKSKSFELPNMPSLPGSRVTRSKPFQNVGIDYCGPFKVKGNDEKSWIILFTCFTTRLIHLELVTSMNAEDFLLSFRNFVGRCGVPGYVLSDNAKQFKTAATALDAIWKKAIKDDRSMDYYLHNGITWDFITERAPWKGGLYERMVGLVKNALKLSIGKKVLTVNNFRTLLIEIEATVNSRPLTYVHAKEPFLIRPADFIYPTIELQLPSVPIDNLSNDPAYIHATAGGGERLVDIYESSIKHLDKFWQLWSKDYLNLLRERNSNEHKNARGSLKRKPIVGEIVLVYEPDRPRGSWKAAKITDLITSSDNEIRSAEIQFMDGFITKRAINHLYPIEEGAANPDILVTDREVDN